MAADRNVKRQDHSPPEKGVSGARSRYKPIRPVSPRYPNEPPHERPTIYSSVGDMERQEMELQRLMNLIYNFTTQFSHLNFSSDSIHRIVAAVDSIRKAIEGDYAQMNAERYFQSHQCIQKYLAEYEKVIWSLETPFALARADGLLLRVNHTFAQLIDIPADELVQKRLSIYDLMTEESSINFVEKVAVLVCDRSLETIYSALSLVRGGVINEDRVLRGQVKDCLLSLKMLYDQNRLPIVFVLTVIPMDVTTSPQQPELEGHETSPF